VPGRWIAVAALERGDREGARYVVTLRTGLVHDNGSSMPMASADLGHRPQGLGTGLQQPIELDSNEQHRPSVALPRFEETPGASTLAKGFAGVQVSHDGNTVYYSITVTDASANLIAAPALWPARAPLPAAPRALGSGLPPSGSAWRLVPVPQPRCRTASRLPRRRYCWSIQGHRLGPAVEVLQRISRTANAPVL
jgi:hypothetical protein